MGTQTFRPIVSSHHYLVRRFAPESYLGILNIEVEVYVNFGNFTRFLYHPLPGISCAISTIVVFRWHFVV